MVVRGIMLSFIYAIAIATFPVSIWFCIKVSSFDICFCWLKSSNAFFQKIKALERCVIFRLGKRLPLKGPGLVIVFPCVDVIDTIDLNPHNLMVAQNEQMLCSDGSVVEVVKFEICISVANAVKSFTGLKDSRKNVDQFIQLAFKNLVSSTHVEDLERKLDWIIKPFIDTCNSHICNWGWNATCQEMYVDYLFECANYNIFRGFYPF